MLTLTDKRVLRTALPALAVTACLLLSACGSRERLPSVTDRETGNGSGGDTAALWRCARSSPGDWVCRPREPVTSPSREESAQTPAKPQQPGAAAVTAEPAAATMAGNRPFAPATDTSAPASAPSPDTGDDNGTATDSRWRRMQDDHVLAQLLAARKHRSVERFRGNNPDLDLIEVEISQGDRPMWLLFMGPYADHAAAREALQEAGFDAADVWLREVAAVRAQVEERQITP